MQQPKPARYGPLDRYGAPPAAGMCLSAFAVVRRGERVLVGRPAPHARWDEWMPSWRHFSPDDLAATMAGFMIPGTYLREGEDPARTLDRVVRRMLGVRAYASAPRPLVYSATSKSGWYPGHAHWDLALAYDVKAQRPPRAPAWWREMEWRDPGELRARDFAWNSDLARALGVAR